MKFSSFLLSLSLVSGGIMALPAGNSVAIEIGRDPASMVVDLRTGDRSLFDVFDYPDVLTAWPIERTGEREVLLAAFDAAQRRALWFYDPETNQRRPVSGYTDIETTELRGAGEPFPPFFVTVARAADGYIYALTTQPEQPAEGEPLTYQVMRVDPVSGDRTIVSRTWGAGVGEGIALANPIDSVLAPRVGGMLVLEEFQGVIQVDFETGDRKLVLTGETLGIAPQEIDVLPDGRVVGMRRDPDLDAVFVHDLKDGSHALLSGEFGGISRGEGPMFGMLFSISVDTLGFIYVLDVELNALLRIDPRTGNRVIVSGGPEQIGSGFLLPGPLDRPRLTRGFMAAASMFQVY